MLIVLKIYEAVFACFHLALELGETGTQNLTETLKSL